MRIAGASHSDLWPFARALLNNFLEIGLWIAAIVGLVFVGLEATGEKPSWYNDWNPDDLKLTASAVDYGDTVSNLLVEGFSYCGGTQRSP